MRSNIGDLGKHGPIKSKTKPKTHWSLSLSSRHVKVQAQAQDKFLIRTIRWLNRDCTPSFKLIKFNLATYLSLREIYESKFLVCLMRQSLLLIFSLQVKNLYMKSKKSYGS